MGVLISGQKRLFGTRKKVYQVQAEFFKMLYDVYGSAVWLTVSNFRILYLKLPSLYQ